MNLMGPHPPELFVVWRRPQGSRQSWEKVPGLAPMEKHEAFKAVLAQQWIASYTDDEFLAVPVGQVPAVERTFAGYQTKVMKPR